MYARTNTVQTDPQTIDEGIANVRDEVMPLVMGMDGCIGLSMLADLDSGRCIVTTAWRTEEAMHASEEGIRASRERAAQVFGEMPAVAEWEIAVMHRMHETGDGARTRVIWGHTDPGHLDDLLTVFRTSVMPQMEELPGFASCNLMINRGTGQMALAVNYDRPATMQQANDRATALRRDASAAMGMEIDEVAEFDLVLAHLRVPETV
jgi:heme-degrading monooxygenase HmoA